MRWIAAVLSLFLLFSIAPSASEAKSNGTTLSPMVRGGADVVVKNVRIIVPSANGSGVGNSVWYIVTFAFTNSTPYPMIPNLQKFMFQQATIATYSNINGDPDLIGITNPHQNDTLKPGATYEYTVGFLVSSDEAGYIFYDRTAGL